MSKKDSKPDNVIPLIREKRVRDVVKNEYDTTSSADRLKERLDSVNQKMSDLREMVRKQNEYLSETGSNLVNRYAAERMKEEPRYSDEPASTLDQAQLEAEYRRKQDEMRKKRQQNNKSVTRSYNLTDKPKRDR